MTGTNFTTRSSILVTALAAMLLCTACSTPQASQLGWESGASSSVVGTNQVASMGPSAGIF